MNPRKARLVNGVSFVRSKKFGFLLIGVFLLAACGVIVYGRGLVPAPAASNGDDKLAAEKTAPVRQEIIDFHMTDLDNGWIRYEDGKMSVTIDGGVHWQPPASGESAAASFGEVKYERLNEPRDIATVNSKSKPYQVKRLQFVTDRIGWALLSDGGELDKPLLLTVDGGETWQAEVTPEARAVMLEEANLQERIMKEYALYASPTLAKKALRLGWSLLPDMVNPGDVVLVRHDKPGELEWQGRKYKLQPFGAGYFTYLPVPMSVKPGAYPIGDQTLTVKAKKFETQYLQVTKQMESMRQDTQRIVADQKKIDLARSKSEPDFLFTSPFIQPIEGILTTPYGYTRYVNGKLDSSHTAIDLAAKEGTPIKATNDGIVALADSLYLTGNSIYIDHGIGLFSQYAHLSELRVKTGDRVKQGDIIGLVGTTGFSTGPHLHFTFWANNVPVNPNLFFNTTPFHWMRQEQ